MPSEAAWPHPLAAPDRTRRGSRTRHRRRRRRASPGAADRARASTTTVATTTRRSRGSGRSAPGAARPRRDRYGLPPGVSDGSVIVANGGRIVLLGGLNAADTSVDTVIAAGYRSASTIGRLPSVRHDTAAARARRQRLRLRRRKRRVAARRHRPRRSEQRVARPSSPISRPRAPTRPPRRSAAPRTSSAATPARAGSTRSSRTAPASTPRVVAHLPKTLRYAAVTAVGKTLVIAGGSLENGTASDSVLAFDPATHRVTRLGTPPCPDHARRGGDARQRRLRDRRPRRDDRDADDRDRRRRRRPQAGARRGAPEDRPLRPRRRHRRLAHHRRRRQGHHRHRRDRSHGSRRSHAR